MFWSLFLFRLLLGIFEKPERLFLRSGQTLAISGELEIVNDTLLFHWKPTDRNRYRLPLEMLNLSATLWVLPKQVKPHDTKPVNGIPWDHEAFSEKQECLRSIKLTTDGLYEFRQKRPRPQKRSQASGEPQ